MNEAPFLIIGSERSGTTLLMAILDAHPRIAVPEVTWYYPRFRAYLPTYGDLAAPGAFRTLVSEMVHGLKTPYFGLDWNPRSIVSEILDRIQENTFAGAFGGILGRAAEDFGKSRWGEKTPHNLHYVSEILEDFPAAKFLHLTRDGRDVAADQLRSAFGPRNVFTAANIWRETQIAAERARSLVPPDQWLDVRYEDLASDPGGWARRALEFVGEAFDPAVLGFHELPLARRRASTRDHQPLGKPVNTEHVGIYRRFLSVFEQEVFEGIAGRELVAAGYEITGRSVTLPASEAALLDELDQRIRAATLDAPGGHIVYESYNDWLTSRREQRRKEGVWSGETDGSWSAQFLSGQRAPLAWKQRFAIPRQFEGKELVL